MTPAAATPPVAILRRRLQAVVSGATLDPTFAPVQVSIVLEPTKPQGWHSLRLQTFALRGGLMTRRVFVLAFGGDPRNPRAQVREDATGRRAIVTVDTILDVLAAWLLPPSDEVPPTLDAPRVTRRAETIHRVRVAAKARRWNVAQEGDGDLIVSAPSPDGPSAPDVVLIHGAELGAAALTLRSPSGRPLVRGVPAAAVVQGVVEALRAVATPNPQPAVALWFGVAELRAAGIPPGAATVFRARPTAAGGWDLEESMGAGAWGLHTASTVWPGLVEALVASRLKAAQ